MIAARRKAQPLGGVAQQRQARRVRVGDLLDEARRRAGVADDAVEPEFGVARELDLARRRHPGGGLGRAFLRRRASSDRRPRPPARRRQDRSDRGAGRKGGRDIAPRSGRWARACRRSRARSPCRSGTGSSPRPIGTAPDRRRGGWRARSPLRRSRSAGAGCREPGAGTPAVRRGTGRRYGRARSRRACA